jgi:hypothetical protein
MYYVSSEAHSIIQKGSLISGVISSIINGMIAWFVLDGRTTLPLTADSVSSGEKTVFSSGVMTAFTLSVIVGTIVFFSFRKKATKQALGSPELLKRPFFFFGVRTILFYALFSFGTAALVGIFLQKLLGVIIVTRLDAAILMGIIAGIASWFINAAVMKAVLRPE